MPEISNTAVAVDKSHIHPAFREHPSRLFVETTTRCNLSCFMCLKQSAGSTLRDGDLAPETFAALEPALPHLDSLVLNGIGEPLLHPRLEHFIRRARELMPAGSSIGFQSNGVLLTEMRAISLVNAGVDRICLSLDGASPATFCTMREGGELADLEKALRVLTTAKSIGRTNDLKVGVEYVVTRDNLRELPAALRWAISKGADFAIVSHVIPYGQSHTLKTLYDTCTDAALSLYHSWKVKAEVAGVKLNRYPEVLWKYTRTDEEQRILNFVEGIREEARHRNIALDIKKLLQLDWDRLYGTAEVFEEARATAEETGLDLRLPELAPLERRRCDFTEQGAMFVSWDGIVHPCHFLWHGCLTSANGWKQKVRPRVFGNLLDQGVLDIWNSREYRSFRENVLRYDHPYCSSCALAPCDYLEMEDSHQDCYLNEEPCGSCLWSMGMFHCLS